MLYLKNYEETFESLKMMIIDLQIFEQRQEERKKLAFQVSCSGHPSNSQKHRPQFSVIKKGTPIKKGGTLAGNTAPSAWMRQQFREK
ncbi:hypothetical protein CEXT_756991 [Caerostris extrusa]|uniref:Uncharacterized protein n=1 Tax=Caerostris extrusa TaxID=172846 RepID=A0AAV4PP90_CAEEX|nr:hypothetical protein CEXT_756991 [Caerostris extrusa]